MLLLTALQGRLNDASSPARRRLTGASSKATPWRRTKARRAASGIDASVSGDGEAVSEDVDAREEGSREEEVEGRRSALADGDCPRARAL